MKPEFISYLKTIGITTETLHNRIQAIYDFYQGVCPEEISDIFVTDYIKEDGNREYENLWFFSPRTMMEAKGFVTKDDFDLTQVDKPPIYWGVQKQDYDFKKATDKSRLHLKFILEARISADLKASKENCDTLRDIMLKYVAPKVKR